mgnify:FL=1|jgi:hypothetical protein
MKLEKTIIKYHGNIYDAVKVTLDENEATPNTPSGIPILFADINLWIDIVGDGRLESDRCDEPQDKDGEEVDNMVYYYELHALYYCLGQCSREEFERFVLDTTD